MGVLDSVILREDTLRPQLLEKRAGIDDSTGKGAATERIVEYNLLLPHLPPGFQCGKGAVVSADDPTTQSGAIDRVISEQAAAAPLVYTEDHSVFPIEAVAGLVEITMRLDSNKLRQDIERMRPVKEMLLRRYLVPVPGTATQAEPTTVSWTSPRCFLVGLPRDPRWRAESIAESLRTIQLALGGQTHVHGLYVIGTGFFSTIPLEHDDEPPYRIEAWTGTDRLFRFTAALRQAFDRWQRIPEGWTADLSAYVPSQPSFVLE